MDTHYLIPLRERLLNDLEKMGRWDLAVEDFERLCKINGAAQEEEPAIIRSIPGGRELQPRQYSVLLQLCTYREHAAQQMDRPLFKVIGDKTLLAIAEVCPKIPEQLKQLPGMTPGQMDRHGRGIIQAVQRGLAAKPVSPPRSQRPDERFLSRLEKLRQWRKKTALSMGVESDVILPRDLLHALAEQNPKTQESLALILKDVPWRLNRFGSQILELLT
jgi:ribonuclease D